MDTISGIPSHPLFVHIPAILLPLAAIGVIVMVIKPAWKERYQWATLAVCFAGMLGAILAAGSGEGLEEKLEDAGETASWESHAEAGELARTVSILFFVLLAAYVLIPWFLRRKAAQRAAAPVTGAESSPAASGPKWLAPMLAGLVVVGAVASTYTVIDAGHSGAKQVWSEEEGDGDGD